MTPGVALRPVEPGDLPAIDRWAGAMGEWMSRTRPHDPAADRHDPLAGLFWYVITCDGVDAGTVWIELAGDGAEAVLGVFLAGPDWFGRGVGTAAVELALAEFRRAHATVAVSLHVRRANARAVACYLRAGFVVTGEGEKRLPSGETVPHYRMVIRGGRDPDVDLPPPVLARIEALAVERAVVLIGVDGKGAAGKSRWASAVVDALGPSVPGAVVHMDDFYLPSSERLPEQSSPAGGAFDWRRLRDEVLEPLRDGRPARFARYDWTSDALAESHELDPRGVILVEGVSTTRHELAGFYDLTVWVDCPRAVRLTRGLQRDGEDARSLWLREWMPAEDHYTREHRPRERADVIVDGTGPAPRPAVLVRTALPQERQGVDEFLRSEAYAGGVQSSDELVVALRDGEVVGAFRLAREDGLLVLRGMRVRSDARGQGVGSRLLGALTGLAEPCYCVPHAHLQGFYGRAGFARLPDAEAPALLGERLALYRERGLDVVVMRREPAYPRFAVDSRSDPVT